MFVPYPTPGKAGSRLYCVMTEHLFESHYNTRCVHATYTLSSITCLLQFRCARRIEQTWLFFCNLLSRCVHCICHDSHHNSLSLLSSFTYVYMQSHVSVSVVVSIFLISLFFFLFLSLSSPYSKCCAYCAFPPAAFPYARIAISYFPSPDLTRTWRLKKIRVYIQAMISNASSSTFTLPSSLLFFVCSTRCSLLLSPTQLPETHRTTHAGGCIF